MSIALHSLVNTANLPHRSLRRSHGRYRITLHIPQQKLIARQKQRKQLIRQKEYAGNGCSPHSSGVFLLLPANSIVIDSGGFQWMISAQS
jgi:hypothetical protein